MQMFLQDSEPRSIRERIEQRLHTLTSTERAIAQHVTQHYSDSMLTNASQVARELNVSPSTVVRFAQKLGFVGYSEFRQALHHEMQERHRITGLGVEAKDFPQRYLLSETDNLQYLSGQWPTVVRSADILARAQRVWVAGDRSSGYLMSFAAHFLRWVRPDVFRIGKDLPDELLDVKADDALLISSMSRYSRSSLQIITTLQGQLPIVLISDEHSSPLAPHAQEVLRFHSKSVSTLRSLTAGLSLVQALVMETATRHDGTCVRLERAEELWSSFGIFDHSL